MNTYVALLACLGALILLVAWLPMVLRRVPLSLPIICVGLGAAGFLAVGAAAPLPLAYPVPTERLTELVVIVALTGAGLKLDRPFGLRGWAMTWRLLGIAMPLSILGIALLSSWLLGFGLAAALLLGAALAPTDPVLAADVQVGPPMSGEEDEVRFTLTAEAGLNDGLAFPFVNLAIALAALPAGASLWEGDWLSHWLLVDVAWKLAAGLLAGWGCGRLLGWITFHLPGRARLAGTGDGFVALGITLLAYGLTELAHGYGFLAVFVAALTIRDSERDHAYHEQLHDFADQTERLLMMVLLVLFGATLPQGLLDGLTWPGIVASLLFVFVVRPAAGLVSLIGAAPPAREQAALAFFGIRGLGSFYYLAYALLHGDFAEGQALWSVLGFTVLLSILLHGTTVTPAMAHLDARRHRARRRLRDTETAEAGAAGAGAVRTAR